MYVSLNILLDSIAGHQHEVHIALPSGKTFNRTALLPRDGRTLTPDWLYICRLSEFIRTAPGVPGVCYVCLRDRVQDGLETEELLANTIVINENMELEELFTEIQDVFFRINEWIQQMQETVIRSRSLQDLLDLSEPVIGNTINISDSALTLLAHTWGIPAEDKVTRALIDNGFHPDENLKLFQAGNRFEVWDSASGLIVNEDPNYGEYPTLGKVFKFHNTYFTHVVMVCDHRPLTPGLSDLFQILLDILQFYVEREWENKAACDHVYDSFFTDLLDGKLSSRAAMEERARHVGVPLAGPYRVLKVVMKQRLQAPMGRMGQELDELLGNGKVFLYDQQLVALALPRREGERLSADRHMRSFLERYDAVCGVSMEFSDLKDMPAAYEKASLALKYSDRFRGRELFAQNDGEDQDSRILVFDHNLPYYLLGENPRSMDIWRGSAYEQAMRTLMDYDRQHNTNNLQLLYTYLRCERKATETGQLMHMHRNNVVYRIGRIEEMLGLSLEDPEVRLCLTVSYLLLYLNGQEET